MKNTSPYNRRYHISLIDKNSGGAILGSSCSTVVICKRISTVQKHAAALLKRNCLYYTYADTTRFECANHDISTGRYYNEQLINF